jgi:hypothetical protein
MLHLPTKKKQRCYSDQFTNNQDVIGERLQVKREEIEQSGPNTYIRDGFRRYNLNFFFC